MTLSQTSSFKVIKSEISSDCAPHSSPLPQCTQLSTYVSVEALNTCTTLTFSTISSSPPLSSWSSHHGPCTESTPSSGYLVRTASSWVVGVALLEEASPAVVKVQSQGNKSQGEGSSYIDSENLYSNVVYSAAHIYVRACML